MKFVTFVEIYKEDIRTRLKESSMQFKEYILDTKITPYFAKLSMNEIKPRHVVAWQNEMMRGHTAKGEKYSPVYLKTLYNQVSAVFNYAVRFYELHDNPAAKDGNMGKAKGQERDFWTQEEYTKFSFAVMDKPASFYAFEVLYWCGIREGELLALTLDDFDLEQKKLTIN